jgi:hypothetical protein
MPFAIIAAADGQHIENALATLDNGEINKDSASKALDFL